MGSISRMAVADRMLSSDEFVKKLMEYWGFEMSLLDGEEMVVVLDSICLEQRDTELCLVGRLKTSDGNGFGEAVLADVYFDEDGGATQLCDMLGVSRKIAYPDED